MHYQEFMQQLQEAAGLDPQAAERAARATLATLGETLYRTEQDDLSAQLSKELRAFLGERDEPEVDRRRVDRFTLEEFYNRVKARAGVGYQQAVAQSRAVMHVLRAAVGDGAWNNLRAQFPDRYADLLAPADVGRQTIRMPPRPNARR